MRLRENVSAPIKDPTQNYHISLETILFVFAVYYFIKSNFYLAYNSISDTFYMVKFGEEFVRFGVELYYPFSWIPDDCRVPWINYQWLAHVILYFAFSMGKLTGVVILKTVVYAVSYSALFIFARNKYGVRPAVLSLILSIYLGRLWLYPLAMMYSSFFFPILTILLISIEDKGIKLYHYALIPLLFLLWVNLHGGFLVGLTYLAIGFVIIVILKRKRLQGYREVAKYAGKCALILVFSFLVSCFCTPYGSKIFQCALDILIYRPVYRNVADFWFSPIAEFHKNLYYFIFVISLLILLPLCSLKGKRKVSSLELFSFFFCLLLSLKAMRNIQIFSTACIPITAFIISVIPELWSGFKSLFTGISKTLAGYGGLMEAFKIIALFLLLMQLFFLLYSTDLSFKTDEKKQFPTDIIAFFQANSLPSNLYCYDILGDYFIYYLYPKYKVGFDSSWNMCYSDFYFIEISHSFSRPDRFFRFIDKYNLDTVILPYDCHFFDNNPHWLLIYEGQGCRVYLRKAKRNEEIINKFRDDKLYYPDTYEVDSFLYRSHMEFGNYYTALKYLNILICTNPDQKNLLEYRRALLEFIKRKESPGSKLNTH